MSLLFSAKAYPLRTNEKLVTSKKKVKKKSNKNKSVQLLSRTFSRGLLQGSFLHSPCNTRASPKVSACSVKRREKWLN